MKFDIFLSICQTEVDGYKPNEKTMFMNFFDQAQLADRIGYETAWVAETHLSCQIQKQNADAVIPHFKGEIGLNTDILQLAHLLFARTKNIKIGSAIRNIICNGGPIAHAEAVKTFLSLHGLQESEQRRLCLGFAAGRFPFSNAAYGFRPQNEFEQKHWNTLKHRYFQQAVEIFLRLLKGEHLSSKDVTRYKMDVDGKQIDLDCHWQFDKVGVIPFENRMDLLDLYVGTHDPETQEMANRWLPCGVFNLSITPPEVIEQTHVRMQKAYHAQGGAWTRDRMPRTAMLYISEDGAKAKNLAERAWLNYWTAMEKTLDPSKVAAAVENTIAGTPEEVREKIQQKYHPQDRLMLWFDFNLHDNEFIKHSMKLFMDKVVPHLG